MPNSAQTLHQNGWKKHLLHVKRGHRRISERKISVRRKAFEKARNIFPPVNSNNTTAIIEFPQYVKISAWPAVLLDERSSRVQNVGLGHHGQGKISLTYTEEEKKTVGRRNRAQRDPTSTKTIRITRLSPKSQRGENAEFFGSTNRHAW